MKKTFCVPIRTEPIISALMAKINWEESERVATGGMMSDPVLIITYEGKESDYSEDYYIQEQFGVSGSYRYYSLRITDGFLTDDFFKFKTEHQNKSKTIEVKNLYEERT